MSSFTVKENHIGSVVVKIFQYRQLDILLLLLKMDKKNKNTGI